MTSRSRTTRTRERWRDILSKHPDSGRGRKTRHSDLMLDVLLDAEHETAEDIFARARRSDPSVSMSTVRRHLHRYRELGLLAAVDIGDGRSRYEAATAGSNEHAHLICQHCGKIDDVDSEALRAICSEVANRRGFVIERARIDLFGNCARCAAAKKRAPIIGAR